MRRPAFGRGRRPSIAFGNQERLDAQNFVNCRHDDRLAARKRQFFRLKGTATAQLAQSRLDTVERAEDDFPLTDVSGAPLLLFGEEVENGSTI